MPTYRTKVGPDGTLVIPRELREKFAIREGVDVEFFLTLEGDVFFRAITGTAAGWAGLFEAEVPSPPLTIAEMDERVADALGEDEKRIVRENGGAPVQRRPAAE